MQFHLSGLVCVGPESCSQSGILGILSNNSPCHRTYMNIVSQLLLSRWTRSFPESLCYCKTYTRPWTGSIINGNEFGAKHGFGKPLANCRELT